MGSVLGFDKPFIYSSLRRIIIKLGYYKLDEKSIKLSPSILLPSNDT